MQNHRKNKWYEIRTILLLFYILFIIINSNCIDGNPRYWSDYYGSLNKNREGYNNPTMEKFCEGLKTCLNQCYEKVPFQSQFYRETRKRNSSYNAPSFYLVNCEKKCKDDYLCR
jgi:hypothetical protein